MAHPALREVFAQLKTRMEKAVEDFRREMAATRTGRANVHMLDTVSVDYYGSQMPLNQIAQIHAPEPQMLAEPDATRCDFERLRIDDVRAALRELPFAPLGK